MSPYLKTLIAVAMLACSGPQSGSESHFLCTTSADCASGLICLAGACAAAADGGTSGATNGATNATNGATNGGTSGASTGGATNGGTTVGVSGGASGGGTTSGDASVARDGANDSAACDSGTCFCDALRSCTKGIGGMDWLPLGSRGWRVCGHDEGPACTVNVFLETEGAESVYRCFAPDTFVCNASVVPGPTSLTCEHVLDCGRLSGGCPADVLACSPSSPTCDAVDPTSFGPAANFLGYAFDGTGCVSVSGDCGERCNSVFPTRQACWQACSRSCTDVVIERARVRDQDATCSTDADCAWIAAGGPPYDDCSCSVALNKKSDPVKWRALNFSYDCFQQGACCDENLAHPVCSNGRCAAPAVASRDAAVDARGQSDASGASDAPRADASDGSDGSFACNRARCSADQYCCNVSCGLCRDRGQTCPQVACTNDSGPPDGGPLGGCIATGATTCPAGQTFYACDLFSFMPSATCTAGAVGDTFTDYCCR